MKRKRKLGRRWRGCEVQLEHLKKVSTKVEAAQRKLEEQLQLHLKQDDRACFQKATEGLQRHELKDLLLLSL